MVCSVSFPRYPMAASKTMPGSKAVVDRFMENHQGTCGRNPSLTMAAAPSAAMTLHQSSDSTTFCGMATPV